MRYIVISCLILSGLLFNCFAENIPQPPISKEISVIENQYLKSIADNLHKLEITTTNPDGSRNGGHGEMVLLETGGNYYLEICVSSPTGTVWKGVAITDTP